eukprot:gnl/Chilomastix_cuspidata/683.p2 GENE.gnl/Chilomastix_cuspidata/683~~gnl/Chilomastix_cuspidata/683.p2  ORF type:complete len:535 (+),score=254.82 gnl/Chilomastix_cuspidata/683:34-1638(+)
MSFSDRPSSASARKRPEHRELLAGRSRKFDTIKSVLLLNCAMAGNQFAFAFNATVVNPYLEFLGMTQQEETLVSLVGPICGFVIQPIFGSWSDTFGSAMGRRRPFLVIGTIFSVISMALIGYGYFISESAALVLGIVGFVLLNISLNIMLCPARAIVSDLVSVTAQNRGQIFSAFMMGASFCLCNFLVYGLTYITDMAAAEEIANCDVFDTADLTMVTCSVGMVFLIALQIPTLVYGKEEPFVETEGVKREFIFKAMGKRIKTMPRPITMVCVVFLGSWAGYYPFQIFCSEIYGLQLGSLANACGSIVTLVYSLFLDGIVNRIGYKRSYNISQGIAAISMIAMVGPYFAMKNGAEDSGDDAVEAAFGLARLAGGVRALLGDTAKTCDVTNEDIAWWIQVLVCVLVGLVGINNATMNSIPFSIVGIFGGETKGYYMGILNCCCVIAQALGILTNFVWTCIFPEPDKQTTPADEYHNADILSGIGPIVACAVYSIIAFFLTFLVVSPTAEDMKERGAADDDDDDRHGEDIDSGEIF